MKFTQDIPNPPDVPLDIKKNPQTLDLSNIAENISNLATEIGDKILSCCEKTGENDPYLDDDNLGPQ